MLKNLVCIMFLRPSGLYARLRGHDLFIWAFVLQFFRWQTTAITTVVALYQENSPMLLPVPFGIDPKSYRYFEIYAYGPYGMLIITLMATAIWWYGRGYAVTLHMTLKRTWTLIGLCFFGPWLPSLLIDSFLVKQGWGGPQVIIPWHISIVAIETLLLIVGLKTVFGISFNISVRLGVGGGALFLFLAGAAIR
ncbi:MAG: hypothetical protein HQL68_00860 [Magnetococcales bacterium]|nr:hypothetical protein [Magnetococcales bacterium]